jgi:hypothetical protein
LESWEASASETTECFDVDFLNGELSRLRPPSWLATDLFREELSRLADLFTGELSRLCEVRHDEVLTGESDSSEACWPPSPVEHEM